MKRPLSLEQDLSFYIYNHKDKHHVSFDLVAFGKDQDFYVLQFHRPGIQRIDLYTLYVLKDGSSNCLYSCKLSQSNPPEKISLLDRQYLVYETYTLAQDREEAGITFALYMHIPQKNTIHVDASLCFLQSVLSSFARNVNFFPWNINPQDFGLKVDLSKVIQRTPLWFKSRGQVSGTKAYMLLGFWVPSKKEDPNWKWDQDRVFDAEAKANAQFGVDSEDKALISYGSFYNDHISQIQLVGWCKAPLPLPSDWGSSPDALVTWSSLSWQDDVPENIRKYYPEFEGKHQNGVLEIKSSRKGKLSMEDYFFPQVYMEMISTQTLWCDLIRYTSTRTRVYRIWRHKPTEETLVSLIKHAYQNRDNLQDVIQEESFVKMRAYFKRLAMTLSFADVPNDQTAIQKYEAYQQAKSQPQVANGDISFLFKKSKWLEEAEQNHKQMYGVLNDPTKLRELVTKQMALYKELV